MMCVYVFANSTKPSEDASKRLIAADQQQEQQQHHEGQGEEEEEGQSGLIFCNTISWCFSITDPNYHHRPLVTRSLVRARAIASTDMEIYPQHHGRLPWWIPHYIGKIFLDYEEIKAVFEVDDNSISRWIDEAEADLTEHNIPSLPSPLPQK